MPKEERPWAARFVDITRYVAVQCGFVYIGEDAEKARGIEWPELYRNYEGPRMSPAGELLDPTLKIYLFGKSSGLESQKGFFRFLDLENQAVKLGLNEAHVEWTFMRKNARIACAPRVYKDALWGFGRPHPGKPHFKAHQDLAGPLVDYRPNTKEGWKFEPVVMKIKPNTFGEGEHVFECAPKWEDAHALMVALKLLPSQVPAKLAEYEFPGSDPRDKFDEEVIAELVENRRGARRF